PQFRRPGLFRRLSQRELPGGAAGPGVRAPGNRAGRAQRLRRLLHDDGRKGERARPLRPRRRRGMSEQAKPPPRKRSDFWGTIPQWISAVAALGILYMTVTGLKAAKPIFENAALREENAQLRLDTAKNVALLNQAKQAVVDQTTNGWRYVRRHYATKALAAAAPDFVLSA